MVKWRIVALIFTREVRDQFRDRRTLFMIAVLPLILYPALGLATIQLALQVRQQPQTVVILGADDLPADPALLDGSGISARWFRRSNDSEEHAQAVAAKVTVVSDAATGAGRSPDSGVSRDAERLLTQAREIRDALDEDPQRAGERFGGSDLKAIVLIPEGFGRRLQEIREQLARQQDGTGVSADFPRPRVVYNKADEKSQLTLSRLMGVLDRWETAILDDWLKLARIDRKLTRPVLAQEVDVALAEQVAASIWSKLFPTLLVVMSVTGAFYPAIDLVAGEKERGTMETLLICPATRTEIVVGKFLTVMLFSAATALLNIGSLGLMGKHVAGMAPAGALAGAHDLSFPPWSALAWILLLLIPLSGLFSALSLALATFARSSKEGQYYLTPLLMVTVGVTMFCLSPTVDLNPQYSVLPVMGVTLLLKGLLLSPLQAGSLYVYVVPVLATSLGYSLLALWWAVDQFQAEAVLFREGERFELGPWLRQLFVRKPRFPTFGAAVVLFVLIMLLQFFAPGWLTPPADAAADGKAEGTMWLLLLQQVLLIGVPALVLGVLLTSSLRDTFRWRWTGGKWLAAGVLLPLVVHPLSVEALAGLHWFFTDLPPEIMRTLAAMSDEHMPLWLVLLAAVAAPACCEELAFRGFILSGFAGRGRTMLAVIMSSAAFGIMHMIPQQVLNASILGIVIAGLALRSQSLLPCLLFHLVNNTLGVCHGRYGKHLTESDWNSPFVTVSEGALRYRWPTLLICLAICIPAVIWLLRPLLVEGGDREAGGEP